MSVFKKLKGTFQTAQQDLVDGIKALTTLDVQPRHEQLRNVRLRHINLDAGGDLLHNYQICWSEMQERTKESAEKAEDVRMIMIPMFKVWDHHVAMMTHLEEEVKTMPGIVTSLQKSQNVLNDLRKDFAAVEKALDILENFCDELDLKRQCQKEMASLAKYKTRKASEAQQITVDLAKKHVKRISDIEALKREKLQDRVEAFSSAFEDDMEFYKKHGHPERVPTEISKVTSLSDISIDDDNRELSSFLDAVPVITTNEVEQPEDIHFIEDDYTADFAVDAEISEQALHNS